MSYMTINNMRVEFTNEKNVLSVIRKAGIDLPTFCYHSELSTYGACRMCVVEDARGKVFASCSEVPRDGMTIYTNTPKLQHHRKMIIELMLSSHSRDCTISPKNGGCTLQLLAKQLNVSDVRFSNYKKELPKDYSSECIIRDPNKCILCGDCVRICDEIQGLGILDFVKRGSKMYVTTAFDKPLSQTECVGCGQCRIVCPTAAISIRRHMSPVWEALADKNTTVIAQIAPAVRVAFGERFGIKRGENTIGLIAAALRRLGFDKVYDTNFGADITVMEESREFQERLVSGGKIPLFTSCCPAWVKYCEQRYPEFKDNLSTCKSPQEMFGALLKEEARQNAGKELRRTVVVSVMPCVAKKAEIKRPEHFTEGVQDVEYSLSTIEIGRMIKEAGIDVSRLKPESLDMPFGLASGGAAIFGVTGGVTEAVLRRLVNDSSAETLENISLMGIRGEENIKEATVSLGGRELKIAVVHGLASAGRVLDKIKAGEVHYDFMEVMACARGCIGGGGQPTPTAPRTRYERTRGIYEIDRLSQIKISNENPIVENVYRGILKGKEHKLLHTR